MPNILGKVQNSQKKPELVAGFLGGLNTFQDETLIKDGELTKAKNIVLTVDGISPRYGIEHYGGVTAGTRIQGMTGYYKSSGTRELIVCSAGKLYKKSGSSWSQIGSTTFSTSARINFIQARDKLFGFNGVDALWYYDGSSITSYSALTTPGVPTVTPTGTTGSTTYSYRISAFNASGETLAGTAGTTSTGNAALDATNYNSLSWSAVSGALGYNVWGRYSTGLGETYLATVYTTTYKDQGQNEPSLSILPPESNSTAGIIAKKAIFSQSRIFAAGDPSYPSRLYYGGVGSNIGNFSFSELGGGATDIFKDDGAVIRDILPYQGGVLVWKDNAIYRFYFSSSGTPTLEEITRSFGGIAWRGSIHVENDVIFPTKRDGRLAFFSLGNQENYAAGVLRTNELSIKAAPDMEDVNLAYLEYATSFYYNNILGCAIPQSGNTANSRIWCLDTRFGSWVHWDDLAPACFAVWSDTDGTQKLLMGSESTGYVEETFKETRSDNGSAISVQWATKAFNQKQFAVVKRYYSPVLQFKDITQSGEIDGDIIIDGVSIEKSFTVNQQTGGGGGFGALLWGEPLLGSAGTNISSDVSADTIAEIYSHLRGRSIKYEFRSNAAGVNFKFLSLMNVYAYLQTRRLPSESRYY